jgi:hypothetical protein
MTYICIFRDSAFLYMIFTLSLWVTYLKNKRDPTKTILKYSILITMMFKEEKNVFLIFLLC